MTRWKHGSTGTSGERPWRRLRDDPRPRPPVTPIPIPVQPPPSPPVDTLAPTASAITADQIGQTSARISWTLSEQATGQVEYGTTISYGLTSAAETSFNWDHHVQVITGLSAGTLYHYRVKGADAAGNAYTSGDQTFTTQAAATPDLPGLTTYGNGVNMAGLNNLRVGWSASHRLVAMPFRARYSLALDQIRWYKEVGAGYSAGTGGSLRWWVYPDNGSGLPDFAATAKASSAVVAVGTARQVGRLDTFTSATALVAGTIYWLVLENTESGSTNYVSWNCAHAWGGADSVHPHRRWPGPADYRPVWGSRSTLQTIDSTPARWVPVHELRYTNGEYQGHSYMEIGHQTDLAHVGVVQASGGRRIRQRFEHEGADVIVNGVGIAMQRSSASTANLTAIVRNSALVSLATATITGTGFPTGGTSAGSFRDPGGDYERAALSGSVTLVAGNTYYLEFSTTGNGHFLCWGMRRGSNPADSFGYSGKGEWPSLNVGRAQISVTDGASWYDLQHWGTRYDFNCYLERAA
jgi:hypothetical protein